MKNVSKKIKAIGLENIRDLGGIVTSDGRKIKSRKLIRSGDLSKLSDDGAEILTEEYKLKTVIDLRMDVEIENAPDRVLSGVETIFCPLLDTEFLGIARDKYSMEAWLNAFKNSDAEPRSVFRDMYLKIALSERNIPYFRSIFDKFLNPDDGSVLWHCSAGKDRVGITTMLLLGALGVDRKSIEQDYHLTEKCMIKQLLWVKTMAPLKGYRGKLYESVVILFSAKREYIGWVIDEIEKQYGSIPAFLSKRIGVTDEEIETLKKLYLE